MKKTASVIALCILFTLSAKAYGLTSEARVMIHGVKKVSNQVTLRAHFVPAPDLVKGLNPFLYLEAGLKLGKHLDISPCLGWQFLTSEPILSVRTTFAYGKFSLWTDVEWQPISQFGYYLVNADFSILKWLAIGIEGEGGGSLKEGPWFHKPGAQISLRFGRLGLGFVIGTDFKEPVVKLRLHVTL